MLLSSLPRLSFFLIILSLITLSTCLNHQISEKELIAFRSSIFTRLDQCTQWRSTLSYQITSTLDHFLVNSNFAEFRKAAIPLASEFHPESIDCIDDITNDIDKYEEWMKKGALTGEVGLKDALGMDRILELHMLMEKTKRPDLIEKGVSSLKRTCSWLFLVHWSASETFEILTSNFIYETVR